MKRDGKEGGRTKGAERTKARVEPAPVRRRTCRLKDARPDKGPGCGSHDTSHIESGYGMRVQCP